MTPKERSALWRKMNKDTRKGDRHNGRNVSFRPFAGVDGEGCGTDYLDRQEYRLLRAGEYELYTGKRLTTEQCCKFITDLPNDSIYVGFAFGYDATMILLDLNDERRKRLLSNYDDRSKYTFYRDYAIDYLPKQYLSIAKVRDGKVIPKSSRTIYETFGFFQKSFARILKDFKIGTEQLPMIEAFKNQRASFDAITPELREYNRQECILLAELMEQLRENCYKADIRPRTWSGAGKLAGSLHSKYNTMLRKDVELLPEQLLDYANAAYYGGRFEITRTGKINRNVYEYDLRSAYPASMQHLPCLEHGKWNRFVGKPKQPLYVASVSFTHQKNVSLCGLPIRHKDGHVYWPRSGNGIYWSTEINAAKKLGCKVEIKDGWEYEQVCSCKMFQWVNDLYEYRKSIGSSGEGYPIKLGINSLYGQLAQRIGARKFGNYIHAGMITAQTRAWIMEAASLAPRDILMIATDGIYSQVPLDLDIGDRLGQWEHKQHPNMFIVQPGLYWGPPQPKMRGIPSKFFEGLTEKFEMDWQHWMQQNQRGELVPPPSTVLQMNLFIGLKLAQSRNKPETAGKWVKQDRSISFQWGRKRGRFKWDGECIVTDPLTGGTNIHSAIYTNVAKQIEDERIEDKMSLDDQPEYLDMGIPWK